MYRVEEEITLHVWAVAGIGDNWTVVQNNLRAMMDAIDTIIRINASAENIYGIQFIRITPGWTPARDEGQNQLVLHRIKTVTAIYYRTEAFTVFPLRTAIGVSSASVSVSLTGVGGLPLPVGTIGRALQSASLSSTVRGGRPNLSTGNKVSALARAVQGGVVKASLRNATIIGAGTGASGFANPNAQVNKASVSLIASAKVATAGKSNTAVSGNVAGSTHTFLWDDGTLWDTSGIYSLATVVQKATGGLSKASVQASVLGGPKLATGAGRGSTSTARTVTRQTSVTGGTARASARGVIPGGGVLPTHIVIVMMENQGLSAVTGNPSSFENRLGTGQIAGLSGAMCLNYTTVPYASGWVGESYPGYLALATGSTFNILHDNQGVFPYSAECVYASNPGMTYPLTNLVSLLQNSGTTFRLYAEDVSNTSRSWSCHGSFSGNCPYPGGAIGLGRASDHFAFLSLATNGPANGGLAFPSYVFSTTSGATSSAPSSTPDIELISLMNGAGPYPKFIWLTPNDLDNGHNPGFNYGDTYLANLVPRILSSTMFQSYPAIRPALFITYDDGGSNGGKLYACWSGPIVKNGLQSTTKYDHYSWLATLEKSLALGNMGRNDVSAPTMDEFFTL